jgi:hypothetical protein
VLITVAVLASVAMQDWFLETIAMLHCFFLPQVLKSAVGNYKSSIKSSVYLCIGLGRLALILYIFAYPDNFLIWRPKYWYAGLVTGLLVLQILLLTAQNLFGPRFMVPQRFKPHVHCYFQPLREIEMAEFVDCNVCLSPFGADNAQVMRTPCKHLFHKDCLTHWMAIKLQCPTCRSELPAIED